MFLFLTLLAIALIMTAVCTALLSAAAAEFEEPSLEADIELQPSRFFAGDMTAAAAPRGVPAELLLSQIERHVRLEQAAAERFVSLPTIESLHATTESEFVN